MLHAYIVSSVILFIGILDPQAVMSSSMLQQNDQARSGPTIVQNCYGFSSAHDIVNRLSQITQKLIELDTKLSRWVGSNSKCKTVPKNCAEIYNCGQNKSDIYKIDPDGKGQFSVYCDQTTNGGGWTVIQRRVDGSTDFFRNWSEYKSGFGNLTREHWLGLDNIHRLTHQQQYKLRVDLEDWNRKTVYAVYSLFGVADEGNKYKLSLGSYAGTAGDSLSNHNGMDFSTKDRDNDITSSNCATSHEGAWWYRSCYHSNLNGRYLHGGNEARGTVWFHWKNTYYSVKTAIMKIRPVSFVL